MKRNVTFLLLVCCTHTMYGIDITWIGSGTQNWSDPTAWSGGVVPTSSDRVFFTGSGNCNLDVNATVSHLELQNGFTGIFNQNSFNLTISRIATAGATGLIIAGGTFNASATHILTVQGDFARTDPAVFNHNNGRVVIRGLNATNVNFILGNTTTFNKLEFNAVGMDNGFSIGTVGVPVDVIVLDTLMKSGSPMGRCILLNGDIFLKGDLIINYAGLLTGIGWGDARIFLDNQVADQHIVGMSPAYTQNFLENIIIDKPANTKLFLHNYITVAGDWHYRGGDIVPGTSTVYFFGSSSWISTTGDTLSGNHTLYNVRFGQIYAPHTRHIDPNTILTVSNELIFDGNNLADVMSGTIHATGDITVTNIPQAFGFCGGDAQVIINGTGNQLFHGQSRRNTGYVPNITIDKSSGTLTLKDTINVEKNWTYVRGDVDAITQNSYINFVSNISSLNVTDIPQNIDGEGASDTMLFNNVGIDNPNTPGTAPITRNLTGALRVHNSLNLRSHLLTMNGHDISIENAATTGIQRTTGMIIGETTPATSPSYVRWFVDNAAPGASYIFPFGTADGNHIPYTLIISTAGTPSGGAGSVSIATYPTSTTPIPNNRPLPPGVTHLTSFIGLDNFARELDRFWIYECANYSTTPTVGMVFTYLDREWNTANGSSNVINESMLRPHQWNPGTLSWDQPLPATLLANANTATVSGVSTCSPFTLVDPTLPDLAFYSDVQNLCDGAGTATFTALDTMPVSRLWVFPGGTPSSSTADNPVVTYSAPGTYDVIYEATFPGGPLRDTLFDYITVSSPIQITTSVSHLSCNGGSDGAIMITPSGGFPPYMSILSNGATGTFIAGLPAGQFIITVADSVGCAATDTATVLEPTPVDLTITNLTQVSACGQCDGTAAVAPFGGGAPYSYLWSTGETGPTVSNLCPGTYIVTVYDHAACVDTVHVILHNPGNMTVVISTTNATCWGGNDGSASAHVTGGTAPYTYSWNQGTAIADSVHNLTAGLIAVTVTDDSLCTGTASAAIYHPQPVTLSLQAFPVSCFGGNDGKVAFTATGGTAPYSYLFSSGVINAGTDTLLSLSEGAVFVTVTDFNGCTVTDSISIQEPDSLFITGVTNASCGFGGSIDISVHGGTPGGWLTVTTFLWSNGATTEDLNNLTPGTYTVTVMDANLCTVTESFIVPQGNPISLSAQTTNATSCATCNGTATALVSGGIPPYTVLWNLGSQTAVTAINLCPGVYICIATDANGCADTIPVIINADTSFSVTLIENNGDCNNPIDTATIVMANGSPPYLVDWGDGNTSFSNDTAVHYFTNPGIYLITVEDSAQCFASVTDTVMNFPIAVSLEELVQPDCNTNNGKIKVAGADGTLPYSFSWNTGATADSVLNIGSGTYSVTVTDSNGCSATESYTLTQNNSTISVSTVEQIQPSCGLNNGKIKVTASGGSPPYSYLWNNGATADSVVNIAGGNYTVTVSDTAGCASVHTVPLQAIPPLITSVTATAVNCTYGTQGSATISAGGGTPPYTYVWSTGQTSQTITGLSVGAYQYTVTDDDGCSAAGQAVVSYVTTSFYVYLNPVHPNCNSLGSISVTVNGGLAPYTYQWNTNPLQTTSTATGLLPGNYTVTVTDSRGCQRTGSRQLTANCSNVVQGLVYHDTNGNCIRDNGEPPVVGASVTASGGSGTGNFYGSTNSSGQYTVLIGAVGTFTLRLNSPTGCAGYNTCPQQSTVTFPALGDTSANHIFGLSPSNNYDLSLHPGWSSANPGFQKQYWILYHNQSTLVPFTGTATIRFVYDSNLVYLSSTPLTPVHDQANHTLTWTVSNVPTPNWNWSDRLISNFNVPSTLSLSYQLQSDFYIEPTSGDCDISDNHVHSSQVVTGSLDPNAKEVSPPGGITETDSLLTYTLHFQNTGNDTTHFVILKDTLPPYVDPATVKNVAFSHPYSEFDISEQGILTWVFNPIYLPDSLTDEAGSQGFVSFVIEKKKGLPLGTEIENKASIYFDYNEPIITNTVKNTLVEPDWVFETAGNNVTVLAVPNPFTEVAWITVKGLNEKFDFTVYDIMGKEVEQIVSVQTSSFEVRRNELSPGVYLYRITSNGKIAANGKLVVSGK